jgi:hypothetical protein
MPLLRPPTVPSTLAWTSPPQPTCRRDLNPEPRDYVGILIDCGTGLIEEIGEPSTLAVLAEYRSKVISSNDGNKSVTIVAAPVGKMLAPGQPTSRILDVIEATQRRGYELLGVEFWF